MISSGKIVFFLGISYVYASSLSAAQLTAQQVKGIVGEPFTFPVVIPNLLPDTEINWRYGTEDTDWPIARIQNRKIVAVVDERFKARLQLDNVTNSLRINNVQTADSGFYQVEIYKEIYLKKIFVLSLYNVAPVPRVKKGSERGESDCVLLCSVENWNNTSLSWQRNGTALTQPTSRHSTQLDLSHHQIRGVNATYRYTCVASNPVSNQTITVTPSDYCPLKERGGHTELILRVLVFIVLTGVVIAVCVWVWKKGSAQDEDRIDETGL
ncbi:T-lymphocyte surface antigen Ly-9-like isoform X1 [Acipenser ruthenus]|uniref:T-lymphocyte surface antigen Ly-9-like isoform X1 n=1 Tax=Acipenser ruthenus TaxID=7906 RepID=UPI00274133C8|nr:T-lymphocyte surface antigen Ly-9-like isoform X1 [Acipenser ruthenus]